MGLVSANKRVRTVHGGDGEPFKSRSKMMMSDYFSVGYYVIMSDERYKLLSTLEIRGGSST